MFAYCGNSPVTRYDPTGNRYCMVHAYDRDGGGPGNSSVVEGVPLRDVTEEINNALYAEVQKAAKQRYMANRLPDSLKLAGEAYIYLDFNFKVNHEAQWDIKRPEPWEHTIGTNFPGKDVQVLYEGLVMTPESLGNYTYSYIGRAKGIPLAILFVGSYYAAGFPTGVKDLYQELKDWIYITIGYYAYP